MVCTKQFITPLYRLVIWVCKRTYTSKKTKIVMDTILLSHVKPSVDQLHKVVTVKKTIYLQDSFITFTVSKGWPTIIPAIPKAKDELKSRPIWKTHEQWTEIRTQTVGLTSKTTSAKIQSHWEDWRLNNSSQTFIEIVWLASLPTRLYREIALRRYLCANTLLLFSQSGCGGCVWCVCKVQPITTRHCNHGGWKEGVQCMLVGFFARKTCSVQTLPWPAITRTARHRVLNDLGFCFRCFGLPILHFEHWLVRGLMNTFFLSHALF